MRKTFSPFLNLFVVFVIGGSAQAAGRKVTENNMHKFIGISEKSGQRPISCFITGKGKFIPGILKEKKNITRWKSLQPRLRKLRRDLSGNKTRKKFRKLKKKIKRSRIACQDAKDGGQSTVPPTKPDQDSSLAAVTGFVLIDADSDSDVGPLEDSASYNIASIIESLNVRADVNEHTESVLFVLDGKGVTMIDDRPPHAVFGTTGKSNYFGRKIEDGFHTITAIPYTGNSTNGQAGNPAVVSFEIEKGKLKTLGAKSIHIPRIDAGDNQVVQWPEKSLKLSPTVLDHGAPLGTFSFKWSKNDGIGEVTFNGDSDLDATAVFSIPGMYVLELKVEGGGHSLSDLVVVGVRPDFKQETASVPVIPTMPWKKGFGVDNFGGSGRHLEIPDTSIVRVTNLDDSGLGSLREALTTQSGPKTVVFEVSGNIELESPVQIGGNFNKPDGAAVCSYVTIAGQTAPSPGITLTNYGIKIQRNCHDILIQHLRIRPGDTSIHEGVSKEGVSDPVTLDDHFRALTDETGGSDYILQWRTPYNVLIDHCSFSWGGDMNFQSGADYFTLSNSISSEALAHPLHPKGAHSKGFLTKDDSCGISGGHDVAVINNILAHNVDRNPRSSAWSTLVANNVVYDYKFGVNIDDHGWKDSEKYMSIVGNYYKETKLTRSAMYITVGRQPNSKVYVGPDNFFRGAVNPDPWNTAGLENRYMFSMVNSSVPARNRDLSPRVWPEGYVQMSAINAWTYTLANSGARPADRDSVDLRIINEVKNDLTPDSRIIQSQEDVGSWPDLAENTCTFTTPENPHEVLQSGYTRLEEYLQAHSKAVEEGGLITGRTCFAIE